MRVIVISLIAGGTLFNWWAMGFLLVEKRREGRQKSAVDKALEEINYHLHSARRARNQR